MAYYSPKQRMSCSICGEPVMHSPRSKKPPRCVDCGIQALRENVEQLKNKRGPAYDKWLLSMKKFTDSTTPPTPPPSQQLDK